MKQHLRLADGGDMHVEIVENAAPIDTIFLHGNMASNIWWEPTLAAWKTSRLQGPGRLILMEWRGFGESSPPVSESQLHPSSLADDVLFAMNLLKSTRANFIAHSTGGIIALYAMARQAQLFDRAVLLDSVGLHGVTFDDSVYAVYAQMRADRELCAQVMAGTIRGVDTKTDLFRRIVDEAHEIHEVNARGVLGQLRGLDSTNLAPKITSPVLVLHGAEDPIVPIADSRELAEKLPHGEFMELKGHGHSMNVEDPTSFTRLVQSFLFGLAAQS